MKQRKKTSAKTFTINGILLKADKYGLYRVRDTQLGQADLGVIPPGVTLDVYTDVTLLSGTVDNILVETVRPSGSGTLKVVVSYWRSPNPWDLCLGYRRHMAIASTLVSNSPGIAFITDASVEDHGLVVQVETHPGTLAQVQQEAASKVLAVLDPLFQFRAQLEGLSKSTFGI